MILADIDSATSAAIPTGSIAALLSFIVVILAGVILWQQKRIDKLYTEKSDLQDKRLADTNTFNEKYETVMGKFSQSFDLFTAKLQATKDR